MKSLTQLLIIITSLSIVSIIPNAFSENEKHPRVAELEDRLRETATDFIKSRFPQVPFLTTVNVIPLRRVSSDGKVEEVLPYMDFSEEEIRDEWDDPATNWQSLIQRSNRITLEVSLSDTVSDSDAGEAKENLFRTLHLVPGRDDVRINLRKWAQTNATVDKFDPIIIGSGLIFVFALLFGLFIIQWRSDRKPKKILDSASESATKRPKAEHSAHLPVASPASSSFNSKVEPQKLSSRTNGSAGFNTFEAQPWIKATIQSIVSSPSFPTLEHLTELENFGETSAEGLGAVLEEFPEEIRKKLFSLGASSVWITALSNPGEIGAEEASLIRRLGRISGHRTRVTEDLLIALWRLKGDLPDFIRGLRKELALQILRSLPADVSLRVAKAAFPGAWADVLDLKTNSSDIFQGQTEGEFEDIVARSHLVCPLLDISATSRARKEREILVYLRFASLQEEREIYSAAGTSLALMAKRPAFFKVVDSTSDDLSAWVTNISLDKWAVALCNLNRHERDSVFKSFSDKQSALLREMIRRTEHEHPTAEKIGMCREEIACTMQIYEAQKAQKKDETPSELEPESGENANAA